MHIRYKPRINLGFVAPISPTPIIQVHGSGFAPEPMQVISPLPTQLVAPMPVPSYMEQQILLQPPKGDLYIPEQFRYTREQLADMLARGASETFERSGEDESGLPTAFELEQLSREADATKQYAIDADGVIVPPETATTNAGLGLLAMLAAFFLFGA